MNEGPLQRSGINIFEPIKELKFDHLGRSQFASRILARVSEPDCPATLGLYGGWGVGKTSILHLMETLNDDKNKRGDVTPIIEYIDVWPYEISGDLAIPLLIHTRKLIGKALPENYKTSWKRILGVLAQAGTDLLLRKYLNLELSDVQNYKDNLQDVAPTHKQLRDLETLIDDIGDARNLFSDLVQFACAANQNRRIVFLIDNLDRCSPENVVRLLESTKNFLDAPNCTWVFAMDSGVIASYIDRKYNDTKMDGNNYLDKIIPEQYHVPPVSFADLRKLVEAALPVTRPPGLPSIDPQKIPQLPETLVPRRLLKTAHRFYRAYTTPTHLGSQAGADMIFALILLYNTWPAFYERFSSHSPDHVRGILVNFTGKDKNHPGLIPLPPGLENDRSLAHYVRSCFIKESQSEDVYSQIASGMLWLREMGLP